ncbi:MAG TPA: O-antigen ligase family protein [Patescibacteria group bacterium]
MVNYEQTRKTHLIILFLYLVLFPFGQLTRLEIVLAGTRVPFYPTDFLVLFSAVLFLVSRKKVFYLKTSISSFLAVCVFSLLFSLTIFKVSSLSVGILYFIRLSSYLIFFANIWNLVKNDVYLKKLIFNSLIIVGVFVAVFGWVQYFLFPDLTGLKILGWDDHYFRITSTFLDPAFTGIILVFTFLLTLGSFNKKNKIGNILLCVFLLITIAFTYSRSSYIALFGGSLYLLFSTSRRKAALLLIAGLLAILPLLPRPGGEGVRLERLNSVFQKVVDYKESAVLIDKSPVFGLGFNNICAAKIKFLGEVNINSHSCSGLDNSFLFVIATTGMVGLIIFFKLIYDFIATTEKSMYGKVFLATGVALLIHTMFTNTLFYPWVLGWIAILAGVSRVKE